jgi:hypothetical protein
MSIKLLENYNNALQSIYNHVGFTEDWVVYPILDNSKYFWFIDGGEVGYADSINELENEEGNYYSGSIHCQRFYEKHVYEGKDYTLVFLDTHTDGMKYFSIFDNNKKHERSYE